MKHNPEKTRARDRLEDSFASWRIRTMMRHRGVRVKDVAAQLDVSISYIRRLVLPDWPGGLTRTSVARWHERVEGAITELTDEKGGVPGGCCGWLAYLELAMYLRTHPTAREEFGS